MKYTLAVLFAMIAFGGMVHNPVIAQDTVVEDQPGQGFDEKSLTEDQKKNVEVLDRALEIIRNQFFDKKTYAGQDLKDLRARYVSRIALAEAGEPLHKVLREMLGEFKVSHLTVIEQEAYDNHFAPEMDNTKRRQVGFDITEFDKGEYFVSDVLIGGAADKAGVKRGDRVMELEGQPVAGNTLLVDAGGDPGLPNQHAHFFIRNPVDGKLNVKLQRHANDKQLVELEIEPSDMNMIQATKNSVTIIEHEGRTFGYIRFWHFLHDGMTSALKRALKKEWELCDGLIIDLRGRGGSPMVMNACFAPFGEPPAMSMFPGMPGRRMDFNMPKWNRPVVALQDSGSRSAKEVYAHNWKYLDIGPVVGESTPGAVLGSTFEQLPDGSYLLYPAQNPRSLSYGNVELEGNPVEPTHPVKDLLQYAAGTDTIKEAGIKVLYGLVKDLPIPTKEDENKDSPEAEEEF
ncbi:MAG: PDZ domain-containing protein [Planctomycetes bacterium]|nr:PDZ domain-containing protein [Planctomycetota bacterium]